MSDSKHTPGPWRLDRWDEKSAEALIRMECDHPDGWRWSGWVATRTEANARLIAAAPTMREFIVKRAAVGDAEAARILESIDANS